MELQVHQKNSLQQSVISVIISHSAGSSLSFSSANNVTAQAARSTTDDVTRKEETSSSVLRHRCHDDCKADITQTHGCKKQIKKRIPNLAVFRTFWFFRVSYVKPYL